MPTTLELDSALIRRAQVVVETRQVAFAEAGDLLIPIRASEFGPEHVAADLAEAIRGRGGPHGTRGRDRLQVDRVAFEDLVAFAGCARADRGT